MASPNATNVRSMVAIVMAIVGIVTITVVATLWFSRDAERTGIEILIPTPAPVTFQISGEVLHPGVYTLDGDPRVDDAIDAAGGLTSHADMERLNLAVHVRDGAKVVVPSLLTTGAPASETTAPTGTPIEDSVPSTRNVSGLLDLNSASKDQLTALPGIGEVRANSIIEWRTNNLISSVDELLAISGIGPSTVESIRDLVLQP